MIPERLAWAMIQDGWILRDVRIWAKDAPSPNPVKDRSLRDFEYIYMFVKSPHYYWNNVGDAPIPCATSPKYGGSKYKDPNGCLYNERGYDPPETVHERSTIHVKSTRSYPTKHPAPFPVELARYVIETGCPKDGVFMDIYGGSGNACIAAKELGSSFIYMDINPEYYDEAVERLKGIAQMSEEDDNEI
jgi:DNA modification methylase